MAGYNQRMRPKPTFYGKHARLHQTCMCEKYKVFSAADS